MPGKIRVTADVLAGIMAVIKPGQRAIPPDRASAAAREAGHRKAAEWIEDNPEAFIEGLRRGFEIAEFPDSQSKSEFE
jgi:hypothetical protein